MYGYVQLMIGLLLVQTASLPRARREFHWDWHQTQFADKSLTDAKLSAADRTALTRAIEKLVGPPNPKFPGLDSQDRVKLAVQSASIKVIALNGDEKDPMEVVAYVQDFCSGDGNCALWFLRKTPHGDRLLLDAIGQSFNVQKTTTNGFRDLVVNMHGSATDLGLKVYRYARGRYWRVACYNADWAPLENGVVHELKEPQITPCGK